MGMAPKEADIVDSIPPSYFGGNMDNWRVGKGATMYYPVAVPGGLFSIGDSHAAQGDSELCGTAIEMSLTGTFQLILHKADKLSGSLAALNYPLLETQDEWVPRVQLRQLSGGAWTDGAAGYLQKVLDRSCVARCVPQDAQFPDEHQRIDRGRGDLVDLGRSRFWRHPGGRRQLGHPRHRQKEPVRGHGDGLKACDITGGL
jgi:hypothetical protein